ncbi:2'-5' RNA ligase family protein [Streptomyces phaeoluteigriseus]|uniref:2'-5' RNA ligase family protein n=1 Tax=Streptomyces phaeoluteigriseus TaxID=114686 RepID=A0ABY4ZAG1_9ACTN|nr:2'-5' RNA ligase family protein [Streptomyces phaeoluteigriseus]USQ85804.1 2'-5' RNA ligase family protein [Streptomyces phaeoluteigriseus]
MPWPHISLSADSTAFPARPPADLRDRVVIAAHDQAAFDSVQTMVDHWDRPGWTAQTRAYYWMLAFPDSPALVDLARRCQQDLAPLGLDPVADDGLHITLTRVGSTATLTPSRLDDVINAATPLLPAAFRLQAVPLAGSRGAVRLTVAPWVPVLALHAALSEAMTSSGLHPRKPTALFRPHLSLAYNNRSRPAAPVIEAVAALRDHPPVDLHVQEVQLVELRREGRNYRWDVVKSLPLG